MNKNTQTVTDEGNAPRKYPDMSPRTFIESDKDKQWLREVHGITGEFAVAMLFGNEDCPSRVETYSVNHYKCVPTVWLPDLNNILARVESANQHLCRLIAQT